MTKRAMMVLLAGGALVAGAGAGLELWGAEPEELPRLSTGSTKAPTKTRGPAVRPMSTEVTEVVDPEMAKVEGKYKVEGNADGGKRTYTGKMTVIKHKETYEVHWMIDSGESYQGIGLMDKDMLTVSWVMNNKACIAYYKTKGDKNFKGRWSSVPGAKNKENLTFISDIKDLD